MRIQRIKNQWTICQSWFYQTFKCLTKHKKTLLYFLPGRTVETVLGWLYIGISKTSLGFLVSRTIPSRVGSNSDSIDCASSIPTSLELKFACVLSEKEMKQWKLTDSSEGNLNYHKFATHGETVTTNRKRRFNLNNNKMQQTWLNQNRQEITPEIPHGKIARTPRLKTSISVQNVRECARDKHMSRNIF